MTTIPSVTERMTRFSREVLQRREHLATKGAPTVTIEQLDNRYQRFCGPCLKFSGVICAELGCSTKLWVRNKYFDLVLDPTRECPYRKDGFKSVSKR